MREVDIRKETTIEQAPTAPLHQTLALIISGDILPKDGAMKDETQIERDLKHQSINELFRISDAIRDEAPSQDKAAEIFGYLKQRFD